MHRIKILLTFLFVSIMALGQSVPLTNNAEISVLTCGTGPEVYALFGHTAIRVNDPQNSVDIVYNYGAFDFRTPNFALKFTKGDLQYFATAGTYADFIVQYDYEQRSVYEQILNISQSQKQQLFDHLNQVLSSNERFYTYKFIDRNCTNMAVDAINNALGGKIIYKRRNTDITYRETLFPFFDQHFYEQLGTQILFGTKVDRQATVLFLPFELKESLEVTNYNGKPLAEKSKTLMEFNQPTPFSWWNNRYTLLLMVAIVTIANKNWVSTIYLVVLAIVGLLFCFTMTYSLHEELRNNYNILLFNPLLLLVVYFVSRKNYRWIYLTSLACVALIAIYLLIMLTKVHLLTVMPIVLCNLIVLGRFVIRGSRHLRNAK